MSRSTEGNWVPGMKCTKCHGTGESEDARTCSACAGTGGVWMKWRQRAEAAEARVAELERELSDLRNAGGPPFIRSEAIRNLKADLDAERAAAGHLHGKIGLLANAAFGFSDNLDTDTTLRAIEAGINDLKQRLTQDHGIVALLEAQNARMREANDLLRREHLEDPRGCHRTEEVRVATSVELSNGSRVSGFAAPNSISIVCDYMGKRTQIAWSNEAAIAVATIILGLHGKLADGKAAPS